MDDQGTALARLRKLLEVGELRFITNMHACGIANGRGKAGPAGDEEDATCANFEHPMTDPRHFEIHDVTSLDGPDDKGYVRAYTAEGDICRGFPAAVLKRLTEPNRYV